MESSIRLIVGCMVLVSSGLCFSVRDLSQQQLQVQRDVQALPSECKQTRLGSEYLGHANVTITGKTCQRWTSQYPHEHSRNNLAKFPDDVNSLSDVGNACRNPDHEPNGPWCYTTDFDTRWEYCDVPLCGSPNDVPMPPLECKKTRLGSEYLGQVSVTKTGKTCQRWTSQSPHRHSRNNPEKFPDDVNSLSDIGNACRNPDLEPEGPWCYTTDPDTRWQYCDVPICEEEVAPATQMPAIECKETTLGTDYAGHVSTTNSGKTCQNWAQQSPHEHTRNQLNMFPDDVTDLSGIENYCRNPDREAGGPWCYTTDPETRWEYCDIPKCESTSSSNVCKDTVKGLEFVGKISVTESGFSCQPWTSQSPHEHTWGTKVSDFPDDVTDMSEMRNYCRNPSSAALGPWCYTTNPKIRWDYCDVPQCEDKPITTTPAPESCFDGGPIKPLNFESGAWVNIFVDMQFECDGEIVEFTYYARQAGSFVVGVWRPHGDSFKLMAKTTTVAIKGIGIHGFAVGDMPVQSGDVLGIHYDSAANDVTGGVVPYEDNRYEPTEGVDHKKLGRFINLPTRDGDMPIGHVVSDAPLSGIWRLPAISVSINKEGITPAKIPTCGVPAITPDLDDRIVGGRPAVPHSWPWMVSLRDEENDHFCGGSLIAPRWVLTAAHCEPGWRYASQTQRQVALGLHHRTRTPDKLVYAMEVFAHDQYNTRTNDNDIMLLKLSEEIQMTDKISSICLVKGTDEVEPGKDCYSAGWGHTKFMGRAADELQQVRIPVISSERCNSADWYAGKIKSSMICAGYEEGGKDSCQGDSGGPLMCQVNDRWVLNGVVSWGKGCASAKKPGIYASVGSKLSWIEKIMTENS